MQTLTFWHGSAFVRGCLKKQLSGKFVTIFVPWLVRGFWDALMYFQTMSLCAARHGPHNATLKPRRWPLGAVLGPRAAQNVRGSYADFGRHGFGSICGWGNSPYVPTMSLDNVPMCTADARPRPPSPGMYVFQWNSMN